MRGADIFRQIGLAEQPFDGTAYMHFILPFFIGARTACRQCIEGLPLGVRFTR
jgi:hypothetical protein